MQEIPELKEKHDQARQAMISITGYCTTEQWWQKDWTHAPGAFEPLSTAQGLKTSFYPYQMVLLFDNKQDFNLNCRQFVLKGHKICTLSRIYAKKH